MKLRNVKPELIKIPEVRVTSYFSEELYAEFKASIAQTGVQQPIVCVEVGEELYLIDGLHRLIEAKNVGELSVPVVVMPGEEVDVYTKNLFLNVLRGRQKVSEMRAVITHLQNVYHLDSNQIREKTGLSRNFIEDLLIISQLPPEVQEAFDSEQLEKGKALQLAKLPGAEVQLRVFYSIDGRRYTIDQVKQMVDACLVQVQAPTTPVPPEPPPPPPKLACGFCRREWLADELKTVFTCPDCESILRMTLRDLEQQAAARAIKQDGDPLHVEQD